MNRTSVRGGGVRIPAAKRSSKSVAGSSRLGKPPTLTEEQIVDAALSVVQAEGLEALSMRRLSRELGRSAMAPYWYVADKNELLDLVARKLLSRVQLPPADSGPWDERLRAVIKSIDYHVHRYPGIASILLDRMSVTDQRVLNGILEILVSAGFKGAENFQSYAMIHTYLFGRYQVLGQFDVANFGEQVPDLDDTLASLLPYLPSLRGSDFFDWGVDVIIEGLRAKLAAKPASRRTTNAVNASRRG
ncbi:TetR/AcrR family transcriptional regulator C-terminal domain-containing protein [Mycobacterium paraseoulense]|nr:TetR/AcrR family transcriptional regulator C-terminal domain-containing protein [Mycobacterium paraseoulense]